MFSVWTWYCLNFSVVPSIRNVKQRIKTHKKVLKRWEGQYKGTAHKKLCVCELKVVCVCIGAMVRAYTRRTCVYFYDFPHPFSFSMADNGGTDLAPAPVDKWRTWWGGSRSARGGDLGHWRPNNQIACYNQFKIQVSLSLFTVYNKCTITVTVQIKCFNHAEAEKRRKLGENLLRSRCRFLPLTHAELIHLFDNNLTTT